MFVFKGNIIKMKHKTYLDYNLGEKKLISHIDAVHAQKPNSDKYTGKIVLGVVRQIDCSGIIAKISRDDMDINRPRNIEKNAHAVDEYRETIREIINSKEILDENGKLRRNYLHLAVHGMKDEWGTVFEIGTSKGNSCSLEVSEWFITKLKVLSKNFGVNDKFPGVEAKIECHRKGDSTCNYSGYGDFFNTIQIEINLDWRKNRQPELINFFSDLMLDFEKAFNSR